MIELVKKAMFTGIGLLSLTKEKVEEVAQEFVEKGKMSQQEGETLVKEMLQRTQESKDELKKQIELGVQATLQKMDIASKEDIAALRQEIAELREKIGPEQPAD